MTLTQPDIIGAARSYLHDGTARTPQDALALARFIAQGRPYLDPDGGWEPIATIDGFELRAKVEHDDEATQFCRKRLVELFWPAQPDMATDHARYMVTKGGRPRGEYDAIRREYLEEQARYAANYRSFFVSVAAFDSEGRELDRASCGDCASHNWASTSEAWVQYWLWDTVAEIVAELQDGAESTAVAMADRAASVKAYAAAIGKVEL